MVCPTGLSHWITYASSPAPFAHGGPGCHVQHRRRPFRRGDLFARNAARPAGCPSQDTLRFLLPAAPLFPLVGRGPAAQRPPPPAASATGLPLRGTVPRLEPASACNSLASRGGYLSRSLRAYRRIL